MASTTQSQPHQLPSPPPSPPTQRHRKPKPRDPFLELSDDALSSRSPHPPPGAKDQEDSEPLLVRIILTPLLMTSFLLSLFYISLRNHASTRASWFPFSFSSSSLAAGAGAPSDPPHQDPLDTTWVRRDSTLGHVEPDSALNPGVLRGWKGGKNRAVEQQRQQQGSWHLERKIRKVAKMEVGDAFEVRGRVIVGLVAVVLAFVVALCLGLRWVVGLALR